MSFLEVVDLKTKKPPIMLEVPVHPELEGPFLISSTKGVLWVEESFKGNFLRLATNRKPLAELLSELVSSVFSKSQERGWGSVRPLSEAGLKGVLNHLEYFGFGDLEMLSNFEQVDLGFSIPKSLGFQKVSWLPEGFCVVFPRERSFVGTLYRFQGAHALLVHNASRGVGILYA